MIIWRKSIQDLKKWYDKLDRRDNPALFCGGAVPVHRFIFRLDFQKPNFNIVNSPGTVMQLIQEMGEKYWDEIQDDAASRKIAAVTKDLEKGIIRQITVEPMVLNFAYDSAKGIEIDALEGHATIEKLFDGVHKLCEHFKIDKIERAGVRLIALSSIKEDCPELEFQHLFDGPVLNSVESSLGKITDTAMVFDGEGPDKLNYHCRFGPHKADQLERYFQRDTVKIMKEVAEPCNLVFDLDFFELKFAMTVSAAKWSKAPIKKAKQVIKEIETYLSEKL